MVCNLSSYSEPDSGTHGNRPFIRLGTAPKDRKHNNVITLVLKYKYVHNYILRKFLIFFDVYCNRLKLNSIKHQRARGLAIGTLSALSDIVPDAEPATETVRKEVTAARKLDPCSVETYSSGILQGIENSRTKLLKRR